MAVDLTLINAMIALDIDLRVYRLAAIKKAAYRLAHQCTAVIDSPNADTVHVALCFRPTVSQEAATAIARRFFDELLDQELREHVAEETSAIRTLIMAQAFSNVDVIKRS